MRILVVDAANVVGSRPDGWWRDRAGAARRLHERLVATGLPHRRVVFVLEGKARAGVEPGLVGPVLTVHAPGSGDDEIVAQCRTLAATDEVTLVTADRGLIARAAGSVSEVVGPHALLDSLAREPTDPTS
jgi:hypothetical protein